jgi:hypothetical protein
MFVVVDFDCGDDDELALRQHHWWYEDQLGAWNICEVYALKKKQNK